MKKYLLVLVILGFIAVWPFLKPGFFPSHDGEWMVIRFSAFHQTLRAGQFPVRFVDRLNNNYGYPVLNFLYPLPFYLAEVPKLAGVGFVNSVKVVFAVTTILSAVAMFWALTQRFGKIASFAGAVIYLFLPYRFVDLYVRGSIGESVAFLFLPLVFGSILKIKNNNIFIPVLAIFSACLILSHNVIAAIFLPIFITFALFFLKNERIKIFTSIAIGLLISAFFWLPALWDLQYVRLSQIEVSDISEHLVPLAKLVIPSWGYGPNPNSIDGLSTQIGITAIFILVGATIIYFKTKLKHTEAFFFILLTLTVSVLMTTYSDFVWKLVPFADIIQYPWRLLSVVVFAAAYLCASSIDSSTKKTTLMVIVTTVAVVSTLPYTQPKEVKNLPDTYYSTNEDTTTIRDEYLPLWVKEKKQERANNKLKIESGQLTAENIRPTNYQAHIEAEKDTQVEVNSIYFPGWQVKVDGKPVSIDYQNQYGLINFKLPKGEHDVIIKYTRTPVHLASEIVSILALVITGVYFFLSWRKRNS